MFIHVELTPNPKSRKFIPGCHVTRFPNAYTAEDAGLHPFFSKLFAHREIDTVFLGFDLICVTLTSDAAWSSVSGETLRKNVSSLIKAHISDLGKISAGSPANAVVMNEGDTQTIEKIISVLDARIRPVVTSHGGDITFSNYSNGVLTLDMKGACSGCPSTAATLKHGIMGVLAHIVPEVIEVRAA